MHENRSTERWEYEKVRPHKPTLSDLKSSKHRCVQMLELDFSIDHSLHRSFKQAYPSSSRQMQVSHRKRLHTHSHRILPNQHHITIPINNIQLNSILRLIIKMI